MLPWILCGVLSVIVIIFAIKIRIMQKSMDEICSCLSEHLSSDTNQLITVSSSDKHVRHLASEIAKQLPISIYVPPALASQFGKLLCDLTCEMPHMLIT